MTPQAALKALDDPALNKRLRNALYHTYDTIGGDCWGETVPTDSIFVEVVCDHVRNFSDGICTKEDLDIFWALSARQRRILCLKVGP